nr:wiskott-Aldrich syndrome protein homolog 1-like [Penaeus vannamei]
MDPEANVADPPPCLAAFAGTFASSPSSPPAASKPRRPSPYQRGEAAPTSPPLSALATRRATITPRAATKLVRPHRPGCHRPSLALLRRCSARSTATPNPTRRVTFARSRPCVAGYRVLLHPAAAPPPLLASTTRATAARLTRLPPSRRGWPALTPPCACHRARLAPWAPSGCPIAATTAPGRRPPAPEPVLGPVAYTIGAQPKNKKK